MDQAKHKAGFGTWLRRTWTMVMLALEGMDRSPMEDVSNRLNRLEREMAALKNVIFFFFFFFFFLKKKKKKKKKK